MRWVLEINFVGRPEPIGFSVSSAQTGDFVQIYHLKLALIFKSYLLELADWRSSWSR